MRVRRTALATTVLVALAGLAGGCDSFQAPLAPQACAWMSGPASGGRTAILLDVSNSTRGSDRAGPAPDYASALNDAVTQAVDRLDTVSIAAFSGRSSDLVWAVRDLSTDYKAGNDNPDNQKDRRTEAVNCARKSVAGALDTAAQVAGTDVLGAMRQAVSWLAAGTGTRNLVVATDGLVTTGCADLTKSSFMSQREIDAVVKLCTQRDEIDRVGFGGVRIELIGIGRPSSDQPVLTAQQTTWLNSLWQAMCGESCSLSSIAVAGADRNGAPAKTDGVQDPVVGSQRGRQVYALPSLFLFDTGSAALKPEALPVLQDISVSIRTSDYERIDVNGYADPRGDPVQNKTLSLRRAESVALTLGSALEARPHGMGSTRDCPYAMALSEPGKGDDLPCARRVEIVVTMKGVR